MRKEDHIPISRQLFSSCCVLSGSYERTHVDQTARRPGYIRAPRHARTHTHTLYLSPHSPQLSMVCHSMDLMTAGQEKSCWSPDKTSTQLSGCGSDSFRACSSSHLELIDGPT
ncbi:unnamed protein product [Protopolystoma xenopodis]|uniref:Uncharacterized protein n=1 Tax=Protopolystoma xenopodis TaxID=117903 RepID=A0A3S5B1C0_9PLAT|nr:unnamed protein product [Protopolystoma xenopodis]